MGHFAAEMAADFAVLAVLPHLSSASRLMIAEIVVQMMLDAREPIAIGILLTTTARAIARSSW